MRTLKEQMEAGYHVFWCILLAIGLILICAVAHGEERSDVWKVTFYCACKRCCGVHASGITASGRRVAPGMVACNWLPFGTRLEVEGLGVFTVEDRGARSLFGDKKNKIKHIDIYMESHAEALKMGVKWLKVRIL